MPFCCQTVGCAATVAIMNGSRACNVPCRSAYKRLMPFLTRLSLQGIRPGNSIAALAHAEQKMGQPLPAHVWELFRYRDGQESYANFVEGRRLLRYDEHTPRCDQHCLSPMVQHAWPTTMELPCNVHHTSPPRVALTHPYWGAQPRGGSCRSAQAACSERVAGARRQVRVACVAIAWMHASQPAISFKKLHL